MLAHFSFEMSFQTLAVCYILTRYTHIHIMCLTLSTCSRVSKQSELLSNRLWYCNAMLSTAYPVHRSASKVNCSGADMQVVSCLCYPVFHPIVQQLPSSTSLDSFSSLLSPSILRDHEWHVPERYVNYAKTCIFQS